MKYVLISVFIFLFQAEACCYITETSRWSATFYSAVSFDNNDNSPELGMEENSDDKLINLLEKPIENIEEPDFGIESENWIKNEDNIENGAKSSTALVI